MEKRHRRNGPRQAAVHVGTGSTIDIKNAAIANSEIGIRGEPGSTIAASNNTFDRVETPFDLEGVKSATVSGTRIANDPKATIGRRSSSVGWRRINGPPLPAFCPQCKAVFPSANYNFGGAYFHAWNNEETCVECGFEHALLSEGVFNLEAETVRILSAPDFTYVMLQRAKQVADDVIAGRLDSKTGNRAFAEISPKLAKLISRAPEFLFNATTLIATVIAAYATVVAAYYAYMQYEHPKPVELTAATLDVLKDITITSSGLHGKLVLGDQRSAECKPIQVKSLPKTKKPLFKKARTRKTRELHKSAKRTRPNSSKPSR